jgi:hypothetical protein
LKKENEEKFELSKKINCTVFWRVTLFLFQFRGAVCRWVSRTSRQADKKCGNLDSCSKSQSFFAGINLVQAGGNSGGLAAGGSGGGPADKSQTLTTSLPDSARVSSFFNLIYPWEPKFLFYFLFTSIGQS